MRPSIIQLYNESEERSNMLFIALCAFCMKEVICKHGTEPYTRQFGQTKHIFDM